MKPTTRLLSLAAFCACSISLLSDLALAQGQPGGGGNQPADGAGGRQPGGRGGQRGGQGGMGGGGGMFGGGRNAFEPSVSSAELDRYSDMLKMTKAQKEAAKTLLDAYTSDYNAAQQKSRDTMEAIREEARDDPSRWQDLGEVMTKFRAERTKLETAFFNDLKETLTPEQQNIWPTIERTRRRETTISRGLMSGERMDLFKIVEGLKLTPEAHKPLEPILDTYAVDLDRELIVRNAAQDKMQGNVRELITGDAAKAQQMMEEGRAAATKVRDVNKRYARQIESALSDEAVRAKFSEAVKRESHPTIYRQSFATRAVDAAAALESLKPEQKTAITEIKDRFARDVAALNAKMEAAYEKRESTITIAEIMQRFQGGGGGGGGGGQRGGGGGGGFGMVDSEELTDLREQRRELETTTVEKVTALLTEDQKAQLPQRGQGGQGGGRGGNNDNGDRPAPRRGGGNRPGGNQPAPPSGRT